MDCPRVYLVLCLSSSLISLEECCYAVMTNVKNYTLTTAQRIKYLNITKYCTFEA
jgi:hypothetical protein